MSIGKAVERNLFNVSLLQHVIRGNFPATKRVSGGVTLFFFVLIELLSGIAEDNF